MVKFDTFTLGEDGKVSQLLSEDEAAAKQLFLVQQLGAVMIGSNAYRIKYRLGERTYLFLFDQDPATDRDRQLVALRANSPLRPVAGRTQDVDGLALFDVARQPCLI